ncbi:MAG: ADP-ribosylglycohydrolase family protein, partial [Desulfobulbaceae bacterium]|nr:ADP-ribosylglycohydrolase family protein [Desulfobulbaceae bacterium]
MKNNEKAIIGALLGCAVGDALGLPYEGLSRQRAGRMLGEPLKYRFCFGKGMISDDTEHTCMTAAALAASGGDPDIFAQHLAKSLRYWLLGLPAGVGFATLRAVLRLWIGMGPLRSGVFSAGNGPAMRSPIIGATVNEIEQLAPLVSACTRITHTDPKAYYGAYAIALAAYLARSGKPVEPTRYHHELEKNLKDCSEEFRALIKQVIRAAKSGVSVGRFAKELGL